MWQLPPGLKPEDILLYSRKSRTDDPMLTVEEVLEKHEQMLDDWVERNLPGMGKIPEENRFREVVSGETIASRPEIQKVLRKAESPRYKAVLCVEPQRLSRGDLEDIGRMVKLLRYSNTFVFTRDYMYDLRETRDREDLERELKRGNEFLEYQKRIQQNGRLLSVQNGNFIGNTAPYGYKKIEIKEGKKKCHTLEPIPEEARIVKWIFEMYRDGYSSHKVARTLNKAGLKTKKGAKWSPESLKRLRSNEHYIGKVVWNKRQTVKTVEDGEIVVSRPTNHEYLVFPGKQPAIIDMDLWDAVQEIRNKIPPVKGRARHANPFAGLIYCKCGKPMTRRVYKKPGSDEERNPPRLLCEGQTKCGTASCYYSEMEKVVVKILKEAIADFELKMERSAQDEVELHRQLIAQQEQRLEELNKLEISQWDKYTQEGMPKHIFDHLNAKVLAEKDEVMQGLCLMRDSMPEPVNYEKKKAMFSDALDALLDPSVSVRKKNLLLKACIDRIEYTRKKKGSGNRRWGDPEPMELDVHLRV